MKETVALPADAVNLARALRFLRDCGVISIINDIDETKAGTADILETRKTGICDNGCSSDFQKPGQRGNRPDSGNYAIAAGMDYRKALAVDVCRKK